MAALVGEELLASKAEAGVGAEAAEGEAAQGRFQYSGGGLGGARYEGIGFDQFGTPKGYVSDYRPPSTVETSSSSFTMDKKPQGFLKNLFGRDPSVYDLYNVDYLQSKGEKGIKEIMDQINFVYGSYRTNKKYKGIIRENADARRRIGIVFQGKENRDQLVRSNKMPAYYSTSNIKALLRKGIMPFGWNPEMAVEQGFGQEVYMQEMKSLTEKRSKEFLRRESDKVQLKQSLGDLKNLRDRFKTRKMVEYFNQY